MTPLFPRSANVWARVSVFLGLASILGLATFFYFWVRSPFSTKVNMAITQPIPFSHKHHVDGLGIDCRFCHTSAEKSSFAGIPSTEVCMKCHSVMWKDSPMLEPVRESFRTGQPLVWNRVHDLPNHVYFDHSIHISKGISCQSCHGQVDQMPLMAKAQTTRMEWCLACHRHPEKSLRPKDQAFNMAWKNPDPSGQLQKDLAKKYNVQSVTHCNACHR